MFFTAIGAAVILSGLSVGWWIFGGPIKWGVRGIVKIFWNDTTQDILANFANFMKDAAKTTAKYGASASGQVLLRMDTKMFELSDEKASGKTRQEISKYGFDNIEVYKTFCKVTGLSEPRVKEDISSNPTDDETEIKNLFSLSKQTVVHNIGNFDIKDVVIEEYLGSWKDMHIFKLKNSLKRAYIYSCSGEKGLQSKNSFGDMFTCAMNFVVAMDKACTLRERWEALNDGTDLPVLAIDYSAIYAIPDNMGLKIDYDLIFLMIGDPFTMTMDRYLTLKQKRDSKLLRVASNFLFNLITYLGFNYMLHLELTPENILLLDLEGNVPKFKLFGYNRMVHGEEAATQTVYIVSLQVTEFITNRQKELFEVLEKVTYKEPAGAKQQVPSDETEEERPFARPPSYARPNEETQRLFVKDPRDPKMRFLFVNFHEFLAPEIVLKALSRSSLIGFSTANMPSIKDKYFLPHYQESLENKALTPSANTYSIGLLIFRITTGFTPFVFARDIDMRPDEQQENLQDERKKRVILFINVMLSFSAKSTEMYNRPFENLSQIPFFGPESSKNDCLKIMCIYLIGVFFTESLIESINERTESERRAFIDILLIVFQMLLPNLDPAFQFQESNQSYLERAWDWAMTFNPFASTGPTSQAVLNPSVRRGALWKSVPSQVTQSSRQFIERSQKEVGRWIDPAPPLLMLESKLKSLRV